MFGVVILAVHFGPGLFSYSNFNFFYTDDKQAQVRFDVRDDAACLYH